MQALKPADTLGMGLAKVGAEGTPSPPRVQGVVEVTVGGGTVGRYPPWPVQIVVVHAVLVARIGPVTFFVE